MRKRVPRAYAALLMLLFTVTAAVPLSFALVTGSEFGGAWWVPLLTSAGLGYASARLLSLPAAIPVAAIAGPAVVCLVILIKALVWREAPAVGDGFAILVTAYAGIGALAAIASDFIKRSSRAFGHQVL